MYVCTHVCMYVCMHTCILWDYESWCNRKLEPVSLPVVVARLLVQHVDMARSCETREDNSCTFSSPVWTMKCCCFYDRYIKKWCWVFCLCSLQQQYKYIIVEATVATVSPAADQLSAHVLNSKYLPKSMVCRLFHTPGYHSQVTLLRCGLEPVTMCIVWTIAKCTVVNGYHGNLAMPVSSLDFPPPYSNILAVRI